MRAQVNSTVFMVHPAEEFVAHSFGSSTYLARTASIASGCCWLRLEPAGERRQV